MTAAREIWAKVENGKISEKVVADVMRAVAGFDGNITIEIRQRAKIRSSNQNRFYQGPFIGAFQERLLECGHRVSAEDIHAGLRDKHAKNGFTILLPDGGRFDVPASTTRLSTAGMEDYLEEIRGEYSGRFGWQLPFPNE